MTVSTFDVTVKNISVDIANMKLSQGDTTELVVQAGSEILAKQIAVKQLFDGCGFRPEAVGSDDPTLYGQVAFEEDGATALYGRVYAYAEKNK